MLLHTELQPVLDGGVQCVEVGVTERVGLPLRVQPRLEEDVVDVEVADPGDFGLLEQVVLDLPTPSLQQCAQLIRRDLERVGTEFSRHLMLGQRLRRGVVDVPEPPEIDGETGPVLEVEDQAVLLR